MEFYLTPLLSALFGVGLACFRCLPVRLYFGVSFFVPAIAFCWLLAQREILPTSLPAEMKFLLFYLLPFALFYYLPVHLGYFSASLLRRRFRKRGETN